MSSSSSSSSLPSTMRAVVVEQYGKAPEVAKIATVPLPTLTSTQVLIKVKAASINPVDFKMVGGLFQRPLPFTPGLDVAGTVVAVGAAVDAAVDGFKVGDDVYGDSAGATSGTFAEYAAVDISRLILKPAEVSFEQAAAAPLVSLTASQMFQHGPLRPGSRVLILGGSGGVGHVAVQLAHIANGDDEKAGTVVATGSANSKEFIEKLNVGKGKTRVILREKEEFEQTLATEPKFDIVLDCVGGNNFQKAQQILVDDGVFVAITPTDGLDMKGCTVNNKRGRFVITNSGDLSSLRSISSLLSTGRLRIAVDQTFSFNEDGIKNLFITSMAGRTKGKLVLKFD